MRACVTRVLKFARLWAVGFGRVVTPLFWVVFAPVLGGFFGLFWGYSLGVVLGGLSVVVLVVVWWGVWVGVLARAHSLTAYG